MTGKINRKVEYALIALKHMRGKAPGELTSAKEISTLYGCPFDVVSRVMQVLAQKRILKSEQGAQGGYQITRDLGRVSFYDLIEMILGPIEVVKCLSSVGGGESCELLSQCNIVSPVQLLNKKLIEFYRSLMVAELFDGRILNSHGAPADPDAVQTAARSAAGQLQSLSQVSGNP